MRWGSGGKERLHAFLLGPAPRGVSWDHVDRDPLNNVRPNLRAATAVDQARNRRARADSASGLKGVRHCMRRGRWEARITLGAGRRLTLGYFANATAAAAAYDLAAVLHGGRWALNGVGSEALTESERRSIEAKVPGTRGGSVATSRG